MGRHLEQLIKHVSKTYLEIYSPVEKLWPGRIANAAMHPLFLVVFLDSWPRIAARSNHPEREVGVTSATFCSVCVMVQGFPNILMPCLRLIEAETNEIEELHVFRTNYITQMKIEKPNTYVSNEG